MSDAKPKAAIRSIIWGWQVAETGKGHTDGIALADGVMPDGVQDVRVLASEALADLLDREIPHAIQDPEFLGDVVYFLQITVGPGSAK